MSFDSLLVNRCDVLSVTHTRDAAGGQVPTYAIKYSNLPTRHEEFLDPTGPPNEIGGAPTLVGAHRFYMRDPGEILTGEIVIDEEGRMLRTTATPDKRRAIGGQRTFRVVTAREVQGRSSTVDSIVMLEPDGEVMRQPNGELMLEPQ